MADILTAGLIVTLAAWPLLILAVLRLTARHGKTTRASQPRGRHAAATLVEQTGGLPRHGLAIRQAATRQLPVITPRQAITQSIQDMRGIRSEQVPAPFTPPMYPAWATDATQQQQAVQP